MGVFDLIRNVARSPAERRFLAEAKRLEAWQTAPGPSAIVRVPSVSMAPFGGGTGGPPGRPPSIEWWNDQLPPSPTHYTFTPGYSDRTYQNMSAPQMFDGFDLDRVRSACSLHRLGWFYETSALMVAILGFAPVMAAAAQAIAPILALPRHVHGGDKGLAKMVASEVEDAICPSHGLHSSPYFPPQLWGAMALYLRFMGFCVLQHVDGEEDPDTRVRPRYTRIAEPWAIQRYRVPRKAIFQSTEGPIEIKNDGKFTLIEDTNEGHLFDAAILALGDEALAGKLTQEQRLRWQEFFASPKIVAYLPEKVATQGEAGDAFAAGLEFIYGPDGRGIAPYGAKVEAVTYGGGANGAQQFQGTLLDALIHIFMVLVGSAGTIGNGMNSGAGQVYQPQKGGSWGVRHDLIRRPTLAMVRGVNAGHVAPYLINYDDAIARAKKAGAWKDPVVTIPLPDLDRDDRIASEIARQKALSDQVVADRAAGAMVDQDRVNRLAQKFEADPFTLADTKPKGGEIFEYHINQKQVKVTEDKPTDEGTPEDVAPDAQRTPPAEDNGPKTQPSGQAPKDPT